MGGCSQTVNTPQHPVAAPGDTRQILFDQDWFFAKDDLPDARAPAFDDSAWRKLNLPHDYSIEGAIDRQWASGTGFLPAGIAWYRKHFSIPAADRGKTITVRFDGVYNNSTVYLNGNKLGDRPYGFISFEYDLSPYLNANGDNVMAVRVDHHDFADSRWYPGSGIYRNVYLIATDAVHVDHYGTFVTTLNASQDAATISIETTVHNGSPQAVVSTTIYDEKERPVTADVMELSPGSASANQTFSIAHPMLWSVDQPVLYTAVTRILLGDRAVDTYRTPFGIRTIKFDPDTGFWLNGQSMKLKGVCLHEDAGALGSAIPRQVWERRLRILKEAGTNAIRCSHNPPAPEFLDLCDRLGFLVMDEAFDEWTQGKRKWIDRWNGKKFSTAGYHSDFDQWADRDIHDMILRDRNHPSIVMWSIGNEIDYLNDPYPRNSTDLPPIAARLIKDVKALDTSRPITAACASISTNLYYPELDIVGYNYQEDRYAADHAATPGRVIFGSENKPSRDAWLAVANNPYICAQFLWTGIDYLGEARAWPNHASPDGFLDLAAFPKPAFYFRQSLWTDAPMVKIQSVAGSGLVCYTNGDAVEFSQNGKPLGERARAVNGMIVVPGSPADGPIQAVAEKHGSAIAEDTFTVAQAPVKIQLQEYKTTLGPGDGPNVAQVELAITDADGNVVPTAASDVAVTLSGSGRLLGIESGDTASFENYQAPHRKAFHGRLLIYVETHGPVDVAAHADSLPDATIHVGD
jgi:beta-galactosidase/beta-glucuronidase